MVDPANVQINPACHISLLRSNVELKIQPRSTIIAFLYYLCLEVLVRGGRSFSASSLEVVSVWQREGDQESDEHEEAGVEHGLSRAISRSLVGNAGEFGRHRW